MFRTETVYYHVLDQHIRINLIRLSRALVNLLDNAHLAAMAAGEKDIRLAAGLDGNHLVLSVRDHGAGFPDDYAPNSRGLSAWGSTGIGLAFVDEVARNHGGNLTIANAPEGGALVCLRLPLNGKEC